MTVEETWRTYASAWRPLDPADRTVVLARCLSDQCVYTDPNVQCMGLDELSRYIEAFQLQLPGGSFRTDEIANHHSQALVSWTMMTGRRRELLRGASFVRIGEDGRLAQLSGFFSLTEMDERVGERI